MPTVPFDFVYPLLYAKMHRQSELLRVILHCPRVIASVNYCFFFLQPGKQKMNENCSLAAQKQQHSAQGVR
jgi:hypothetical protein